MGGRDTTVAEFLGLTPQEEMLVETGLVLSNLVREERKRLGMTQKKLAALLGTSQPNVARMEQATGTSFEALFQALFAMGVSPKRIASEIGSIRHIETAAAELVS